ncbi:MAG: autotransporter domain-containing protein [Litoreibacter sp.]
MISLKQVLSPVVVVLAICSNSAQALDGFQNNLSSVYGVFNGITDTTPLTVESGFPTLQQPCSQCHANNPADANWNPFGNAVRNHYIANGRTDISASIRAVAEADYVPQVNSSATNFRLPANGSQNVDLQYQAGRSNISGGSSSLSGATNFDETQISGGFPFSFTSSGDLISTASLGAGSVYRFKISPHNAAGFHPITDANRPIVTLTVNTPPNVLQAAINTGSFNDNDGVIVSPDLASSVYFNDANAGDVIEGVDGSATVTALRDQDGAIVSLGEFTITPIFTDGVLSFNANDLDDLGNDEKLIITFSYSVRDRIGVQGLDTVTNTYTVTVDGVSEAGANDPAAVSTRSLVLSEDDVVPIFTDLLNDDSGTPFIDADGDALSVDSFVTPLDGNSAFSLSGNIFSVIELSAYQNLSAGQSESFSFTYIIEELRDGGTERYETSNQLNVTINGANDPVTANDFNVNLDETIILNFIDLIALSEANDLDANDTITATNLRDVVPDRPLRNPQQLKISEDGKTLQIAAAFDENLDEGTTANILVTLDLTDGNGSSVPVTITFTITGQDTAGHGAQAGLYANSLAERYELSSFQDAASQPAACFTCHTPASSLFSAKPDCMDMVSFTEYGSRLCQDDRGGPFGQRMANAESFVAPQILIDNINRELSSGAGSTDPDPIPVDAGRTVDGDTSSIHSFYLEDDFDGAFFISAAGIVQTTLSVDPGKYILKTYPRNIAASKDASGALRNVAGFYPRNIGLTTITVTVTEDLPILTDDVVNAESGAPIDIFVGANDTDGGRLRTIALATNPSNGSAEIGENLSIIYTPASGFAGTDSFTYSGSNFSGDAVTTATVTIEVFGEGELIAQRDTATTAIGKSISVSVLANDLNVNPDETVVTLMTIPDVITVGSTSIVGQNVVFTPTDSFRGTTEIRYAAVNPNDNSRASQALLIINVVEVGTGAITAALEDPQLKQTAAAFEVSCGVVAASNKSDRDVSDFLGTCAALNTAAVANEDLQQAIKALQNEENLASVTAVQTIARGLGQVVSGRLANIREGGARGFDFDGLNFSFGGQRVPTDVLVAMAQTAIGIRKPRYVTENNFDPIWGGFISGQIAFTEKDENGVNAGFELVTQNLMLGVDYDWRDGRYLGVAIGYSNSDTDFASGGSLTGKGFQATAYGVIKDAFLPGLTFEGYVSIGKVKFESARRILFTSGGATVDTFANASFDAEYLNISPRLSFANAYLETGDRLGGIATGLRTTWFGQLDLLLLQTDNYTETGGAGLALRTQGETYRSLLLTLGVDLSRPIYVGTNATGEIFGTLSLNGELLDRTRSLTSSFAVAGTGAPTFTVTEDGANGIGGTVEIGVKVTSHGIANTEVRFGHDFVSGGVRTNRLSLGWSRQLFGNDRLALGYDRSLTAQASSNWNANLEYQLDF